MNRSSTLLAVVAAGAIAVGAAATVSAQSPSPATVPEPGTTAPATISVTGTGTVTVEPDTAVVNVGVEARAMSGTEAMDEVRAGSAALTEALEAAGVDPDDVQTSRIDLYSWQRDDDTAPIYEASLSVTVTIRDVDAVGPTIDAAHAAVGEGMTIGGIDFSHSDPEAVLEDARRAAVAHAAAKAEQFADEAGVTVGAVLQITERGARAPELRMSMPAMEMADADDGMSISPGTLDLEVTVNITYAIVG